MLTFCLRKPSSDRLGVLFERSLSRFTEFGEVGSDGLEVSNLGPCFFKLGRKLRDRLFGDFEASLQRGDGARGGSDLRE